MTRWLVATSSGDALVSGVHGPLSAKQALATVILKYMSARSDKRAVTIRDEAAWETSTTARVVKELRRAHTVVSIRERISTLVW
jgi:hypothetical protein